MSSSTEALIGEFEAESCILVDAGAPVDPNSRNFMQSRLSLWPQKNAQLAVLQIDLDRAEDDNLKKDLRITELDIEAADHKEELKRVRKNFQNKDRIYLCLTTIAFMVVAVLCFQIHMYSLRS